MMNSDSKVIPLFPDKPYAKEMFRYNKVEGDVVIASDYYTLEDLQEQAQINHISVTLCNIIATAIEQCGFEHPNADDDTNRDFCLVIEALVSMVRRYNGKEHSLQILADSCINVDPDDQDGYTYEFRAPGFITEIEP